MILLTTRSIFLLYMSVSSSLGAVDTIYIFGASPRYVRWWPQASSCLFHCIFSTVPCLLAAGIRWPTLYCAWVSRALRGIYAAV